MSYNTKLTLEQLENDVWDETELHSDLVRECYRLRKLPLSEFSNENLSIMLCQGIGVIHLLPLAIDVLVKNQLAEGDSYQKDLLCSVLRLPDEIWIIYPKLLTDLKVSIESIREIPQEIADELKEFMSHNA